MFDPRSMLIKVAQGLRRREEAPPIRKVRLSAIALCRWAGRRRAILGCLAALLVGAAVTDGVGRLGAQQSKDKSAKAAADKAAAEPAPGRAGLIEVRNCIISLVDEVTLATDRPGIVSFVTAREGDKVVATQEQPSAPSAARAPQPAGGAGP